MSSPDACGSQCGATDFFGAKGIDCIDDICVCPEGFSGQDDWNLFKDSCQVDLSVKDKFHTALLVVTSVSFVITTISCFVLAYKWDFLPFCSYSDFHVMDDMDANGSVMLTSSPKQRAPGSLLMGSRSKGENKSKETTNAEELETEANNNELSVIEGHSNRKVSKGPGSFTGGEGMRKLSSKVALRDKTKKKTGAQLKLRQSQKHSMIMNICYATGNLLFMVYAILLYKGQTRDGKHKVLDFVAVIPLPLVLLGIYSGLFAAYLTLPSLSRFGHLLGVTKMFVTNPRLVPRILLVISSFMAAFYIVLFACDATLGVDNGAASLGMRQKIDYAWWLGLLPFLITLPLLYEMIFQNVEMILRKTDNVYRDNNAQQNSAGLELDAIKVAMQSASLFRYALHPPVIIIGILAIISIIFDNRQNYVLYTITAMCTSFFTIPASITITVTEGVAPGVKVGRATKKTGSNIPRNDSKSLV